MASSSKCNKKVITRRTRKGKKPRKTQIKKPLQQPKSQIRATKTASADQIGATDFSSETEQSSKIDDNPSSSTGCSTPKAERFRIPEIATCPPAPKKQRPVSNCSLRRRSIAFFTPPDIEHFFLLATSTQLGV